MPDFSDVKELEKYLQKQIADALRHEVADTVSDLMLREINDVVYNAYSPVVYQRRYDNGGLADPNNIDVSDIEDGVSVSNVATDDDGFTRLDEVICTGDGYTFSGYGYKYEEPRDFYKATRDRLNSTGEHIKALKKALKRRGIDVE